MLASLPAADKNLAIGFILVSYNSAAVLGDAIKSIPKAYPVVVVDNASHDTSVIVARSLGASVIANNRNVGFGAACNQAARMLTTPYLFFLNPDATLHPGALEIIQQAIETFPDAAGFGPSVDIPGEASNFRSTSYVINQGRRYLSANETPTDYAEVDFLDGAAFLVDRNSFWRCGGFDENIFLYYDDDDLSFRLRQLNKKLIYVPQAKVSHLKKNSSKRNLRLDYSRAFHETRSRLLLNIKYGIPTELRKEKKRAVIRVMRALAVLNFRKTARYLGTLSALNANLIK